MKGYTCLSCNVTEKAISKYYGQFRVPDLKFNTKWGDISTPEYDNLASDVKMKVRLISYVCCVHLTCTVYVVFIYKRASVCPMIFSHIYI